MDLKERLAERQEEIFAILKSAQAMLIVPAARDIAGLARARWALMRALTAYQMLKQSEVFGPAIRARGDSAAGAERLQAAGDAAVDAFRGNVTRWSAVDIAATWSSYQPSALAMIGRLREQVTRERHDLNALLRERPSTLRR